MESFMGDLSACETMIMKVIWDAKEDIALQDLIRELADRYKKNYACLLYTSPSPRDTR